MSIKFLVILVLQDDFSGNKEHSFLSYFNSDLYKTNEDIYMIVDAQAKNRLSIINKESHDYVHYKFNNDEYKIIYWEVFDIPIGLDVSISSPFDDDIDLPFSN